ncbi:MAG TPA: TetR/AcrR family transcriptional regulator [Acidimicrobiales bacterium]|nr:TetR/AcrR family transcriptional regulator [Acidimicrobiales bacterium]
MPKQVRDPHARVRVIEAARRTIAARGFKGATVRAIADEAGVSTGFVMHYFADKQQVADEVLRYNNRLAAARVVAARKRQRGTSAVLAMAEALLPYDEERRLTWQVWAAAWSVAQPDEPSASELETARAGLAAMLADALGEAVIDGDLPSGLDLTYEADRLEVLLAGLGLRARVVAAGRRRRVASRMLADHLAALAGAPLVEVPSG